MVTQDIKLTKTQVIELLKDFPEEVSADDLIERIIFLKEVEKALQEVADGRVVSHTQVKEEARRWLKK